MTHDLLQVVVIFIGWFAATFAIAYRYFVDEPLSPRAFMILTTVIPLGSVVVLICLQMMRSGSL